MENVINTENVVFNTWNFHLLYTFTPIFNFPLYDNVLLLNSCFGSISKICILHTLTKEENLLVIWNDVKSKVKTNPIYILKQDSRVDYYITFLKKNHLDGKLYLLDQALKENWSNHCDWKLLKPETVEIISNLSGMAEWLFKP